MAPASADVGFTLVLSQDERNVLRTFLDQMLRDKAIEVHRTDAIQYREHVQHEMDVLQSVLGKLR